WQRLDAWRDPITLWLDVLAKQPESARVHGNLGKEYHNRRELAAARRHLTRAYQLDPRDVRILANLARVEADDGDPDKGLAILLELERGGLRDYIIYSDIGWLQTRLGRLAAAAEAYERALSYEPRMTGVNYQLAQLYLRLGDLAKARERAARELRLNPAHAEARRLLQALGGGG
ncbi:MAG: tetratricopeptide repeat protein, partial [Deferrisomatales bacterium]